MTHRQCPECEETLVCPGHGTVQGPLVSPCPTKRGGLWVSVRDAAGLEVPGVAVEVRGRKVTTDATGLAAFDPLDDGSYSVELGELPRAVLERFAPPAVPRVTNVSVAQGKVALVELVLRRLPTVKVTLSPAVAATVTLADGGGKPRRQSTHDGTVDFGPVPPGTHTVQVELDGDVEGERVEQTEIEVTADYDDDVVVPVEVRQRVNPVIEHEGDAVAVGGERRRVTLRADGPFQGAGRLTITEGQPSIRVLRDEQVQALVDGILEIPALGQDGVVVELEGVEVSAFEGVTLRWALLGDDVGPAVTTTLTAVKATLVIHDVHDMPIARETAREDGRVLVKCQAAGRRAKVTAQCEPAEYVGRMQLVDRDLGGRLRLHRDATGNEALVLPHTLTLPLAQPAELYVEGIGPSPEVCGDVLELDVQGAGTADHVVLTVVEATLEVCGPRPPKAEPEPAEALDEAAAEPDPEALDEAVKRDPGRALLVQGWDFASPRALVRVRKQPIDAPCTLRLVASGDQVRLFSTEHHEGDEVAEALPRAIAADEITDANAGLRLWAEGAVETAEGAAATLRLDVDELVEGADEVGFTVGLATVEVEVTRRDEAALTAAVRVELRDEPGGTVLFHAQATPATGKALLRVPPASYAVGVVAGTGSAEAALRVLREPLAVDAVEAEDEASANAAAQTQAREAAVRVLPGEPTTLRYAYAPAYERIQLIAYQIRTGTYLGKDDVNAADYDDDEAREAARDAAAKADIAARCTLMKEAVAHARAQAVIDPSPTTLKLFMAPEFYFRGSRGAYPLELLSHVPEQMRQETDKPEYADWMFVFGSAIGRMKQPERVEHPGTDLEVHGSLTSFRFRCARSSVLAGAKKGWVASLSSTGPTLLSPSSWPKLTKKAVDYGTATVDEVFVNDVSAKIVEVELVCKDVPSFSRGDFKLTLRAPDQPKARKAPKPKVLWCIADVAVRCDQPPAPGWSVEQGGVLQGTVTEAQPIEAGRYWLRLDRPTGALPEGGVDVTLVSEPQAEIFNVAFVQQGGAATSMSADGGRELRERLVYKETISSVDFQGDDFGTHDFYDDSRHRAEIDGDPQILLIPTAGSTDVLGSHPNRAGRTRRKPPTATSIDTAGTGKATEQSASGLGGGSVFTMHDITFGLEVCLDHATRRLVKYYAGIAKPGEPKVQVHLIPSCGMSIKNPCCVPDGLVFNVDSRHCEAKGGGGTEDLEAAWNGAAPVPAGIERGDYFEEDGVVRIYAPQDTPTADVV